MDDLEKTGKLYTVSGVFYTANHGQYKFKLGEIVLYLKRNPCAYNNYDKFDYYFLISNGNIVISYFCDQNYIETFSSPT